MLYSVNIRLAVICGGCNNAIPVNGILSSVKCQRCQEKTSLSGRLRWAEILNYQNPGIDVFTATMKHRPGKGDYGAWEPVKLNTLRKWPQCQKCKSKFKEERVVTAAESGESIVCEKCSTVLEINPAPELLKHPFPFTRYIVGGVVGSSSVGARSIKGKKPIVMACMSCGGTLEIDGSNRMVECSFCSASNYLPDPLWLSIHPVTKRENWYVLFEPP